MILASHVIFSAYGFWLPNDPRGSWSDFVRKWELLRFGPATKVTDRRSVAGRPHDRAARLAAKRALTYPPVHFTGAQAQAIGFAFRDFIRKSQVAVLACSILPDHVHMVIGRHHYHVEQIVNLLKGEATRRLLADNLHPLASCRGPDGRAPRCWAQGLWKVFLDSGEAVEQSVHYVEQNPPKEGKPPQRWSFVTRAAAESAPLTGRGQKASLTPPSSPRGSPRRRPAAS